MITQEFIDKIASERDIHMLTRNTTVLDAVLMATQKDIEKIKNHLGLNDGRDTSKKSD